MILEVFTLILVLATSLVIAFALILFVFSEVLSFIKGAPFVTNDAKVIETCLELAGVSSKDTLIDLGCGNGKVLLIAQRKFGVKRAIGYEISPLPYLWCRTRNLEVYKNSLFEAKIPNGSVVIYLYLLPKLLKKVSPFLQKKASSNSEIRIVSSVFPLPNWKAKKICKVYHKGFKKEVDLFLY